MHKSRVLRVTAISAIFFTGLFIVRSGDPNSAFLPNPLPAALPAAKTRI